MMLRSQMVRANAPESDPLKIGMGWTVPDLAKPQIFVVLRPTSMPRMIFFSI